MSEQGQVDKLKPLQGTWRITGSADPRFCFLPGEVRLNEEGNVLVIEDDRITHNGETVATLADNPYSVFPTEEVHRTNGSPLVLTLPDGRRLLCSHRPSLDGREFRIIYPHTACTRSGQVVRLARVSE